MSTRAVKVGLGFVAIVAIFEAVQAQAVLNGLFMFVVMGIVPGTDIILSPDATILCVVVVVLGIFLVWNRRRLLLGLRQPHLELEKPQPVFEEPTTLRPARPRLLARGWSALGAAFGKGLHACGMAVDSLGWLVMTSYLVLRRQLFNARQLDRALAELANLLDHASLALNGLWRERKLAIALWLIKARNLFER